MIFKDRIGRRLEPDQPRIGPQRASQRLGIGKVRIGRFDAGRLPAHHVEQPPRAAVDVVADNDVRVLVEAVEHGRGRSHAGREGETGGAAFEIGDAALERHARRVLRARIFEALVDAWARLRIGRGRVDRRHHRAGRRIVVLAGMDAAGGEAEPIAGFH